MRHPIPRQGQSGLVIVEFALLMTFILLPLLFGIMEMGRLLFYWNTATEATRLGARIAVVCDVNEAVIKDKMTALFPVIAAADIRIDYRPDACNASNCEQVTVRIEQAGQIETLIPFVPLALKLPPFSTTLRRESMHSSIAGSPNPVCS